MTLRRDASGSLKPLAILPVLAALTAVLFSLFSLLARAAPLEPMPAASRLGTDVAEAIEQVALKHHLVSSQTSLVAVDTSESRPDGKVVTTTKLPLNLPDSWVYDKVYGRPAAGTLRAAAQVQRKLAFDPSGTPQAASSLAEALVATADRVPAPPPQVDTALGSPEAAPASDSAGRMAKPQETGSKVLGAEPSIRNGKTGQT